MVESYRWEIVKRYSWHVIIMASKNVVINSTKTKVENGNIQFFIASPGKQSRDRIAVRNACGSCFLYPLKCRVGRGVLLHSSSVVFMAMYKILIFPCSHPLPWWGTVKEQLTMKSLVCWKRKDLHHVIQYSSELVWSVSYLDESAWSKCPSLHRVYTYRRYLAVLPTLREQNAPPFFGDRHADSSISPLRKIGDSVWLQSCLIPSSEEHRVLNPVLNCNRRSRYTW